MNFFFETFFGTTRRPLPVPSQTTASIENDKMYNELQEPEQYEIEELDKDDLQSINDAESERVKQWRDPKFRDELKGYLKDNYNRDSKVTNRQASKLYKKMYEKDIRPNDSYSLIDKIQHHPDLTIIDNDYINALRRKTLRYAGIVQITVFALIFQAYRKYPKLQTPKYLGILVTSPGLALLGTFYMSNKVSLRKARQIGLDKKYGLQ